MAIFDILKEQRRLRMLQDLSLVQHKKCLKNLDDIQTVGIIVHNLTDEEQFTMLQFEQLMSRRGIPIEKIELGADEESYLDNEGIPKAEFLHDFINKHYDILIDTTINNDFFGLYVSLRSKTSLRVAYADENQKLSPIALATYDLFVQGSGPRQLVPFLTGLLTILSQIRKN